MLKLHEIVDDEIVKVAREDPRRIIESFFHIVDKNSQNAPFIFNPAQDKYYKNRTARDDILKARKEGFSSLILAILTVKFLFLENVNCVCISHEDDATQRLLKRVIYYVENMEYNGEPIEVDISDKSRKRLKYKRNNNTFYVGTAGSKAFGRGDDIHYLHCSEVAFWEDASRVLTGLQNAVPDNLENTYIVKESTANGYGTFHHAEWEAEKAGESVYKPHFFGWHEDPTNKKVPEKDEIFDKEDMRLKVKFNLTDSQLSWRKWKIKSMQANPKKLLTKEDLFKQEFPITDIEAFLSTGRPVFSLTTLRYYEDVYVKKPEIVGELIGWHPPVLSKDENEYLKIWKKPESGEDYVIGADIGETSDKSYAVVIKRSTFEQVAEWHGQRESHEFAAILCRLGYYYNTALLCIERNNQGIAVVKKADELEYPNQYIRKSSDSLSHKVYSEFGWRTDLKTRPQMMMDINQSINNRQYIIRSQLVIDQLRTFIRNEKGKAEAAPHCHDDAVIGNAIAIQMYKELPEPIDKDTISVREYKPNTSLSNFLKE